MRHGPSGRLKGHEVGCLWSFYSSDFILLFLAWQASSMASFLQVLWGSKNLGSIDQNAGKPRPLGRGRIAHGWRIIALSIRQGMPESTPVKTREQKTFFGEQARLRTPRENRRRNRRPFRSARMSSSNGGSRQHGFSGLSKPRRRARCEGSNRFPTRSSALTSLVCLLSLQHLTACLHASNFKVTAQGCAYLTMPFPTVF